MPTTFQKRQKEMKRQEKQKMKAERREQRKLQQRTESEAIAAGITLETGNEHEVGLEGELEREEIEAAIRRASNEGARPHNQ